MLNLILRAVLFLMGLVFAASLALALLLLVVVWMARAAWARLTGQPVRPWVMRFDPRAGFERFRAAGREAGASAADVANARARGESAGGPLASGAAGDAVTDVRARPIRRSD